MVASPCPSVPYAHRHQILLVEDNPGDADLARERLAEDPSSPVDVWLAGSLREALAILVQQPIDAIILDLNLPDSQGMETLRRIRAAAQGIPTIVVSGVVDDSLAVDAHGAGATGVFGKDETNTRLFSHSVLRIIERAHARTLQRRLEALLEATPDAILVVNQSGVVRYVNQAAQTLFGRSRDELLGELLGFSIANGKSIEITIPRPGDERFCEMRVVELEWQGELAFLGSIRDLTALQRSQREALEKQKLADDQRQLLLKMVDNIAALAEKLGLPDIAKASASILSADPSDPVSESILAGSLAPFEAAFRGYIQANGRLTVQNKELADAKAASEAANRELQAFTSAAAHDLRAPLRAIEGFSKILQDHFTETLDKDGRRYLDHICTTTRRMTQLIEDLLALSRVRSQELKRSTVDLSELAHAVGQRLLAMQPSRQVEFVIANGLFALADPSLVEAVLENLLSNALKFSAKREHARIEFGSTLQGNEIIYHVRDNGAGFDMTLAHKLFQAFQRLHPSSEFEGTGIGLHTTQRIIQRHGGNIWAESVLGEGAVFRFSLEGPTDTLSGG